MNVAYHSSDGYVLALGVSLVSLYEHNKSQETIDTYIIEDGITETNQERLRSIAEEYGRSIHFIPMPDINKKYELGLKAVRDIWIFNSYCRLFLYDILPSDVHKVLYLDSDTIICGNLSELWGTDMGEYCVAGIQDCIGNEYKKVFHIREDAKYCNSGVILQDLDRLREVNVIERIREYVGANGGYVYFMEQTVMNAVFQNEIKILPLQYNVYTILKVMTYDELVRFKAPVDYYSMDEIRSAVDHPKIMHLTTCFLAERPWIENSRHPDIETFTKYKLMTPWRDEPAYPDTRTLTRRNIQRLIDSMPRKMVISVAGILNRYGRIWKIRAVYKRTITAS